MSPADLRLKLGLSRSDWARALNVNERTVIRWEDEGNDPRELAREIMIGIRSAIEAGHDPKRIGQIIRQGIGALLLSGFERQLGRKR